MQQRIDVSRSMKNIPIGKKSISMKRCRLEPLDHRMEENMNFSVNYQQAVQPHLKRRSFGNFKVNRSIN